ncbi:superoxide dismutase family protein [Streptomyces sp. FXJ1.172]|uniref:superoxide dismutase family protein n=1 Tax=Streptomyces sp. FXJ1.172 TaxID=710705 RepID=UPI0007CFE882|nr:superoxide dismutase family protein [Streptomyces sp. FXJ1.172]WEO97678.1 superoxide dismutase family protein [Streptomyces sp. FXJ1.172]
MVAAVYTGALAAALFATGSGSAPGFSLNTTGVFTPPATIVASKAVTYDQKLVPTGAMISVRQQTKPNGATTVELRVAGLRPGRQYGAHIHQKACGAKPDAAGKHYQDKAGTDPAHVNNKNEVWLDFKTDATGIGQATAQHAWAFRKGQAASVVIHSEPGTKGSRAACFTVPFGGAS